jgi:CHAD domain-containing protein
LRRNARRRLKKLGRSTNDARDAEVGLAWILTQHGLTARERPGAQYMRERLERALEESIGRTREKLDARLPRLIEKLSRQLDTYWLRQDVGDPRPPARMTVAVRDALAQHAEAFAQRFAEIDSASDAEGVHRARIAVKRLRYLLEPLGDDMIPALVQQMGVLQALLGSVHDARRSADRWIAVIGETASADARTSILRQLGRASDDEAGDSPPFAKIRPGLTTLVRRAQEEEASSYKRFRRRWRRADIARLTATVEGIAQSMA